MFSSQFKSFAYLYNEDQFIFSLAKDVKVVRTLPKYLKGARRKKEIPVFKVPHSASPFYYLRHVLPVLKKHSVVELVVSNGGCLQVRTTYASCIMSIICLKFSLPELKFRSEFVQICLLFSKGVCTNSPLTPHHLGCLNLSVPCLYYMYSLLLFLFQAILPPYFEEYQRLRCRVSFHALQFRQEVQELSAKILQRQDKLINCHILCLFFLLFHNPFPLLSVSEYLIVI